MQDGKTHLRTQGHPVLHCSPFSFLLSRWCSFRVQGCSYLLMMEIYFQIQLSCIELPGSWVDPTASTHRERQPGVSTLSLCISHQSPVPILLPGYANQNKI